MKEKADSLKSIKLTNLIGLKEKIEKTQNSVKSEIRDITRDPASIKRVIMEYCKQLHAYIWQLGLNGAVPQNIQTTKLTQYRIYYLNNHINIQEI